LLTEDLRAPLLFQTADTGLSESHSEMSRIILLLSDSNAKQVNTLLSARRPSPSGGPNQAWREAAAHQRVGRRAKKDGACAGRPRLEGFEVEDYAALAFLIAVAFVGFGCGFAAVFLTACAFSFAANSALTFWVMASVSTL